MSKRTENFMAIDQYGHTHHGLVHPRRDLLEKLGYTHADKMYQDTIDGDSIHTGYIIGGLWLAIYQVKPWHT